MSCDGAKPMIQNNTKTINFNFFNNSQKPQQVDKVQELKNNINNIYHNNPHYNIPLQTPHQQNYNQQMYTQYNKPKNQYTNNQFTQDTINQPKLDPFLNFFK
jgi:hypothetical protein